MAPIAISPSESQVDMHSQKNVDMERRDSTSPLQGVGGRKMPQRKRTIDMNDGNEIPQIALGVYKAPNGQETEDAIIAAMLAHPILIERPVVVTERGAALCRPAERVRALLPPG